MKKVLWIPIASALLLLAACSNQSSTVASEVQDAQASQASPLAPIASAEVSRLPAACQTLLANIERCVVKYERIDAAAAKSYREQFEQLQAQMDQGVDEAALEQACVASNKQAQNLPATQC